MTINPASMIPISNHPAFYPIALALLLLATNTPAQKSKPAAADFFPLRVDDSWTYRNTSDDSRFTLKVLKEEKQGDGSTRYLVEMMAGVQVHRYFSKPEGWVLLHFEQYPEHPGLEAKYEPPKRYLQNPLVPGFKWQWNGKDYTQQEFAEDNTVAEFEDVTVPAGKFRAIKLVSQVTGASSPMTRTYWYAEGVGLIKTTTEAKTMQYGSELVHYSFKKTDKK
jgi:hypothetical protein